MKTLADLKAQNTDAIQDIRAIRERLATQRTSIANAGYDAGGDPTATAALKAARIQQLRDLETAALAKIDEHRAIEKETRAILAGGLGVALSAAERGEVAHFRQLYRDPEELPLADIQAQLQAAVLHQDRPAMFFWSNEARRRMAATGRTFGADTRNAGQGDGASRGRIQKLIGAVDETLRDRSADPVIEAADRLRDTADDLRGYLWNAGAQRGEGAFQAQASGKTVKIAGDDYSGFHAADDVAS